MTGTDIPASIEGKRPPTTSQLGVPALLLRLFVACVAAGGVVVEHGFAQPPLAMDWVRGIQAAMLGIYAMDLLWRVRQRSEPVPDQAMLWIVFGLLSTAAVGALGHVTGALPGAWQLVHAVSVALFFGELWRMNVVLSRLLARPGLLLPLSFFTLIAIGTVLIKAPVAVPPGQHISWVDAVFTMTSAVCVTGLTVRSTATEFTPYGQTVIAVFIQLGGLGIIIFGSVLAMLLGRSLSLRENMSLSQMLNDQPLQNITGFVRFIVLTTLGIELAGAMLLYPLWQPPPGVEWTVGYRVGLSLFHSVSAFCNAGFDITGNSLVPYRYSMLTHAVILPLIVLGGVGFPVLDNVFRVVRAKVRDRFGRQRGIDSPLNMIERRISLHTKIVLTTTASVYLFGVVAIAGGQLMPYVYEPLQQGVTAHTERPAPISVAAVGKVIADASAMSISARTAGFNSVPMEEISPAGRFTLMSLMLVGGSPGSTAGGTKTVTIALLVLSVLATMLNRQETEAFGRQVADSLVRKAATLGICYILLIVAATLMLSLSEPYPFERVMFEVISAATTTGLSLGITPDLTSFGKVVIIAVMYLGRVGPLALLGALIFSHHARRPYAYAHEGVVLG